MDWFGLLKSARPGKIFYGMEGRSKESGYGKPGNSCPNPAHPAGRERGKRDFDPGLPEPHHPPRPLKLPNAVFSNDVLSFARRNLGGGGGRSWAAVSLYTSAQDTHGLPEASASPCSSGGREPNPGPRNLSRPPATNRPPPRPNIHRCTPMAMLKTHQRLGGSSP